MVERSGPKQKKEKARPFILHLILKSNWQLISGKHDMDINGVEILLVEDNMNDAEMTIRALKKKNLANKLVHLKDGAEALDFLFAEGKYESRDIMAIPKVILLDLKMPKINGLEV